MQPQALIVGAGMAGVSAALELARSGVASVLIDKGRRPGGRMATRSIGDARFDHGAQHFSIRSTEFAAVGDPLQASGVILEWYRAQSRTNPDRGTEARRAGVRGMRSIVETMAAGLDVRTSTAVSRLAVSAGGVVAHAVDGDVATGAAAIVTAPLPQSLELLANSAIRLPAGLAPTLERIEYESCLAVMASLDGTSGLADGHASPDHPAIAWIGDNQHKGVSAVPAVTIHSTARFAAHNLDADPEEWSRVLAQEAEVLLTSAVVDATPHRWRYSRPTTTLDTGAARVSSAPPIVLAGEVFAGARVEGAFLSGLEAARIVLESL